MVEDSGKKRSGVNTLTLALLVIIAVLAILGMVFSPRSGEFLPGIYTIIYTLLTLATDVL